MIQGEFEVVKRKGVDQSWFRIVQMAEQNKQSVLTASILLYAGFYLLVGVGGVSFQLQPAIGYVDSISNTNCPAGSMWIDSSELHWCDGSTEFYTVDETGDLISQLGSVSGPSGAVWIEGSNFHWIDEGGVEYRFDGALFETQYYWYDTSTYYSNNEHPTDTNSMNQFFDTSNSGVSFGGSGSYNDRVYWWTNGWDAKPSYLPGDGYSWKMEGFVYAPSSGTYDFAIDSDDASDLWIDGDLVVSWYGGHGTDDAWTHTGSKSLEEGWHRIKVRMEEGSGGDGIGVAWQKPGDSSYSVIPGNSYSDGASSQTSGSTWLESRYVHYIDENGNERVLTEGAKN